MSKKILILPDDCPFRKIYGGSSYCEHKNRENRYCIWVSINCPMSVEELRKLKITKIIKRR